MRTNFSHPVSAPEPTSVSMKFSRTASCGPIRSAIVLLFSYATFPRGPAYARTSVPSSAIMSVGSIACFISTAIVLAHLISSGVIESVKKAPHHLNNDKVSKQLSQIFRRRNTMTINSVITELSHPVSLVIHFYSLALTLTVISRSSPSLTAFTRLQEMVLGPIVRRAKQVHFSGIKYFGFSFEILKFSQPLPHDECKAP
ncbi:formate--tetrahydrofolate ligase [Trypanosoma rangeli]|uniref:Formate--tetrahydrofolate ligase n=1 Tax=Trypanosoma rangeli TaxID=5698 RepID=A0A422NLN9_TRYRA|nr:formate--tetrahydrofolate ligase [Trypanosoma rangeli]RNF06412.1 formate--tetrahydrofolate ligase [Trypanosoma rangeli]|eukprot:RNF06412.1 formate--tetrahydrofolate ligase [Trypanosoma rangeli]